MRFRFWFTNARITGTLATRPLFAFRRGGLFGLRLFLDRFGNFGLLTAADRLIECFDFALLRLVGDVFKHGVVDNKLKRLTFQNLVTQDVFESFAFNPPTHAANVFAFLHRDFNHLHIEFFVRHEDIFFLGELFENEVLLERLFRRTKTVTSNRVLVNAGSLAR